MSNKGNIPCIYTGKRSARHIGFFTVDEERFEGGGRLPTDVPQVILSAQFDDELRGIKLTPRAAAQLGARLLDLGLGMMKDAPVPATQSLDIPVAPTPVAAERSGGTCATPVPVSPAPPDTTDMPEFAKESLGGFIRWRRKYAGLTQADVAKALGVSTATVGFWETNRHVPPSSRVSDLAAAINTEPCILELRIEKARADRRNEGSEKKRPGASAA